MLKTVSSIVNAIGALNYKGTWDASTNTPTITSSVGVKGDYYVVSVGGSTNINGISNWGVGDWIAFNGSVWQRVEGGADLNGVNVSFTGTASGPTYETSNAAAGLTIADNDITADGTDANIDIDITTKGTGKANISSDALIQGVTVGRGAGSISTNTAIGASALAANTTGSSNTAVGEVALLLNDTGINNTAIGRRALSACTSGQQNTAVGFQAGLGLTTGTFNTFVGRDSGETTTTGAFNTMIGYQTETSAVDGNNQIVIAADNVATVGKGNDTGYINPNLGGVYQGNNSSSWSTTSDQRLKKNIVDNTDGLNKINGILVRNFEYRTEDEVEELDPSCAIRKTGVQLGVIAQELQQICPDCVKEESTGVLSVDSDNVFWYMVNAIKELSSQVAALQTEVNTLKGQ